MQLSKLNTPSENSVKLASVPISKISPSPYQTRKKFDSASINELAHSIRQNGLLQPVVVRQSRYDTYELIAGERRLRACKVANLSQINVIIINASNEQSAILCMVENVQREQLHFFEIAQGYKRLIQIHCMTQDKLAKQLGIQQSTIANKIRVLRLDETIKDKIIHHSLTERHARALLRLPNNDTRQKVLKIIISKNLNVKASDDLIHTILTEDTTKGKTLNIKRIYSDWRLLNNSVKSLIKKMRETGTIIKYDIKELDNKVQMTIIVDKALPK